MPADSTVFRPHDSDENISFSHHSPDTSREQDRTPKIRIGNISKLLIPAVREAFASAMEELGGEATVLQGLDQSRYQSWRAAKLEIIKAVAMEHAKLAAVADPSTTIHELQIDINVVEYKRTILELLQRAFIDHGRNLKKILETLRTVEVDTAPSEAEEASATQEGAGSNFWTSVRGRIWRRSSRPDESNKP
jgi:hypothetical protein